MPFPVHREAPVSVLFSFFFFLVGWLVGWLLVVGCVWGGEGGGGTQSGIWDHNFFFFTIGDIIIERNS